MKTVYTLLLTTIFVSLSLIAGAQCAVPAPPTAPACGSPGQTALPTSGSTTINSGTTDFFSSASAGNLTNFTINGGVLLVCGPGVLTLTTPTMWSGTIIVEPGATLNIIDEPAHGATPNAMQMNVVNYGTYNIQALTNLTNISVNAPIWNYGTMGVSASLTFNGGSGLYNALTTSSAVFAGNLTTFVPTVNNGTMQVGNKYTFTSTICLGGGSNMKVDSLFDNGGNNQVSVTANGTSTSAGLSITGNFTSNTNTLTSSSSVVFCAGPSENNKPQGNIGSATLQPNCTNAVLPVTLIQFSAQMGLDNACTLEWSTAMENGLKDFNLEYSLNGSDYVSLTIVIAHNQPSSYNYSTVLQSKTWFRLRIDNMDGTYSYSPVVLADFAGEKPEASYIVRIQPNLITNNTLMVWTTMKTAQSGKWVVIDMTGRAVYEQSVQLNEGSSNADLLLPSLSSGMYRLLFLGAQVRVNPVPFSVVR